MPAKEPELELIPEGALEICRFAGKDIRRQLHNDEWHFSIVDVIAAFTSSERPRKYWNDLKRQLLEGEGASQLSAQIGQLKMPAVDGVQRETDCGNTEAVFRIIQSIPSPKAEPFKRWLAKVGYERIKEHQNPSIAIKRAIVDYQLQGRPLEWIETRLRTILSRKELTDEWQKRGLREGWAFAALTDVISKHTFGKTTREHKDHKGLKKNAILRDNMTGIELILTMLGETSAKEITRKRNAHGYAENQKAATSGGKIAGTAREALEKEIGESVVSKEGHPGKTGPSKELLTFPGTLEDRIKEIASVPNQLKKPKAPKPADPIPPQKHWEEDNNQESQEFPF